MKVTTTFLVCFLGLTFCVPFFWFTFFSLERLYQKHAEKEFFEKAKKESCSHTGFQILMSAAGWDKFESKWNKSWIQWMVLNRELNQVQAQLLADLLLFFNWKQKMKGSFGLRCLPIHQSELQLWCLFKTISDEYTHIYYIIQGNFDGKNVRSHESSAHLNGGEWWPCVVLTTSRDLANTTW